MFPNFDGLLNDKLGLHFDIVKTNKFADLGSINRPFNEGEKEIMQNYINNGYELFVKRCADGRGMSTEAIKKIAEGRVWTGAAAKELGLVDELGGLDKALEIAVQKAGVESYSVINFPSPENPIMSLLDKSKEDYIQGQISRTMGEYHDYIKFIQNIKDMDHIQARMPFTLNIH